MATASYTTSMDVTLAGKELDVIQPRCRRLACQFAIFSQDGWEPQGFEVMIQKDLRGFGHAARPRMRAM